jgi:hypothetical protein
MTTLIPEKNGAPTATATSKKPKANKKAHVAPRRANVAPAQAKSARKATPAKKGPKGRTARGCQGQSCSRWQQDRQDPRPAETAGRRDFERTDESHRLAAAFGSRLPVRHGGQENGIDRYLHQGRRRRANLLGRGLTPRRSPLAPPVLNRWRFLFTPLLESHLHQHHQIEVSVFVPSAQPADLPIVESRAQFH